MSLNLDALRSFVKVVELLSFSRAAQQLGLSKATVSLHIQQLEAMLGAKLLHRSTRVVRSTPDGHLLLLRARHLLAEAEMLSEMFRPEQGIKGRVRADFPVTIAREVVIPRLPEFFLRHPGIELVVSATDRRVDAMAEGFDFIVRVGDFGEPSLVGRRLGFLRMMNCASPGYLRSYGVPGSVSDLDRHLVVNYSSTLEGDAPTFEYPADGGFAQRPVRSQLTVNNVEAYYAAAVAGLGIIQVSRAGVHGKISTGALVEVLADHPCEPMPVGLLHTHGQRVPRSVRATMAWVEQLIVPFLQASMTGYNWTES